MPRSLFCYYDKDTILKSIDNAFTESSHYSWISGLQTLTLNDFKVVVNPDLGSWVVFDENEYHDAIVKKKSPQGRYGEFFFQMGLCTHKNEFKNFNNKDRANHLYFFEFAVTTGCNLSCKYCFADSYSPSTATNASADLGKLLVDRIAEYRADTKTTIPFILEFTGGEPLLNFQVIKQTVSYAERSMAPC